MTCKGFAEETASESPAPGGGSIAAYIGALGAALGTMVANLSVSYTHLRTLNYPGIGERESYVIYHEELESLVKNYPTIRRARFWMTFGLSLIHI